MLNRMLKIENVGNEDNFDDVQDAAYYYDEIAAAKKLGLIEGVGNNLFEPEKEITRQDIFVMTYRALKILNIVSDIDIGNTSSLIEYNDGYKVSDYAADAIVFFTENNVLCGENGYIKPVTLSSRAETAAFLAKLLQSELMVSWQ
jgi:hypothetical protein